MALIGASNAQKIWNYLKNSGMNEYGIAGLMGNLYHESGLMPNNLQNSYSKKLNMTDEEYTRNVDSGVYTKFVHDSAGYGLAQWTYWSRKRDLMLYANKKRKSIGDLEMQLEFMVSEIKGYKKVYKVLCNAKSVKEASDIVLCEYEKPADQGDKVKDKRAQYGQRYFNLYSIKKETNTTSVKVMVGEALGDENGRASGGQAGDQTKREVLVREWKDFGQEVVLRFKDVELAIKFAEVVTEICSNDKVGYDQKQRTTLYDSLKEAGWDPEKIKDFCEVDCSALVAAALNAIGIVVSKDLYTGNLERGLMSTGKFESIRHESYLRSSDRLLVGDVLLKAGNHAAVVVSGKNPEICEQKEAEQVTVKKQDPKIDYAMSRDASLRGTYKVTSEGLNLRAGAGTHKEVIAVLVKNMRVNNYGYYTEDSTGKKWLYVKVGTLTGFVSELYVKKC